MADAAMLPTGTVVFLRTDIEGSVDLVRSLGARYDELDETQRGIVRSAIAEHGGRVVRTEGDGFFAVFTVAANAARAAVQIQRGIVAGSWPQDRRPRLRAGLHAGAAHRAGDDYGGLEVSRAARIAALAWGEQIVVSEPMRVLLSGDAHGWSFLDLGRHRLKGFPEPDRLFQLSVSDLRSTFPPLAGQPEESTWLPERMTTFIGREHDLETLSDLLAETRLLTLTGPGGTGKTALALESARREASAFADGARFVDLQAVRDPGSLRAEIARAVGLFDGPSGPAAERLESYLAERELLLVLDNFEQLADAADQVTQLLRASPRSKVLVTSRTPLFQQAELEYPVGPLQADPSGGDEHSEAVRLFMERARRARPGMRFDGEQVEAVREICRLVDGLPLGIELCAARVRSLPLGVIRDRLTAREPLPGSGPHDLPERQRTIEAAVAWSEGLLSPPLQRLFARLAVFEESFDLDQAEQVCGPADEIGTDVLDGVVRLSEHSLLARSEDAIGSVRYRWLEPIRSHALHRLSASDERSTVEGRHVEAFAGLAARAAAHMPGGSQAWWLDRLSSDAANLRAASERALRSGDVDHSLAFAGDLWRYWLQSGRLAEGHQYVSRALALPGADAATPLRVRALDAAGGIAYWSGDVGTADGIYEEELALARHVGDRRGEAIAQLDLFFTREFAGDIDDALTARSAAEAIMRELGDEFGLARVEVSKILVMFALGRADPETHASAMFDQADWFLAMDDPWLARYGAALHGMACWARGDIQTAVRWLVRALRENLAVRERTETALAMQFFVVAAERLRRFESSAVMHGACQAAQERLGIRAPAGYSEMTGIDPVPTLQERLGAAFAAAVERGRRLTLEAAVDFIEREVSPEIRGTTRA
jgi:predicted ATPase/class 3 adenylate cyclase